MRTPGSGTGSPGSDTPESGPQESGAPRTEFRRVVVLSGGVGGAKLVKGLSLVLPPESLTVIGNVGDDIVRHGLHVSPDIDTVIYTLAGVVNPETGWGIAGDTFRCLDQLGRLGEETWFRIGDRDLATHLLRTEMLSEGASLTEVTRVLAERLGLKSRVVPPTDDPVRTEIRTPSGWMSFQNYFVRRHCEPEIHDVVFRGADQARPSTEALAAIHEADLILLAPSNPVASIGPILAVPGIAKAISNADVPRVAVCPFVGGASLKGPSDRMMRTRGFNSTPSGVGEYYRGLIDAIAYDKSDGVENRMVGSGGPTMLKCGTIMRTAREKKRLAKSLLDFAAALATDRVP